MARKILLADDSVTAQNMGRKILTDAGYEVITVNNGSAALKRVAEQKPDLIVLDVYMPGYSGLEVCQRLKDSHDTARIPILLTVGKLEPFKPEEARRVRADSYIVKPFEASELLSALTRLEDRMVPQADGPRFSTNVYGVERFDGEAVEKKSDADDTDTGWKNRIRFPSKKKKPEPEPEPESDYGMNPFRDFRRGKGRAPSASPTKTAAEQPKPAVVPDIPRDITPDELDALSALAAKLDGPVHASEGEASPTPKAAGSEPAAAETSSKIEVEKTAAEAVSSPETPAVSAPASPEAVAAALPEMPVEPPPATAPDGETVPASQAAAAAPTEDLASPHPATASLIPEPALADALIAAPVDQDDEPLFSLAPALEAATETQAQAEALTEPSPVAVEAMTASSSVAAAAADLPRVEAIQEARTAESKTESPLPSPSPAQSLPESTAPEQPVADLATPVDAPAIVEVAAAEAPAVQESAPPAVLASSAPPPPETVSSEPTEEELAAALRLLTPAESSSMPSQEVLVAAGAVLAEEAARRAGAGNRWVAEAVALTPEEATVSLEAEMFQKFSMVSIAHEPAQPDPATTTASVNMGETLPETITAASSLEPELTAEDVPTAAPALETTVLEAAAQTEAPPEPAPAPAEAEAVEAAAPSVPSEPVPQEPEAEEPGEEPASATFADATLSAGIEFAGSGEGAVAAASDLPAAAMVSASAEAETSAETHVQSPVATSEAVSGSEEPMAKNTKDNGKSKSGWHQIRTAPASAPSASDPVESAKQREAQGEEHQKAMAAAAAGDDASAPAPLAPATSTSDAGAIANIVDSVLADLRPKIVEEIAKKLAGK